MQTDPPQNDLESRLFELTSQLSKLNRAIRNDFIQEMKLIEQWRDLRERIDHVHEEIPYLNKRLQEREVTLCEVREQRREKLDQYKELAMKRELVRRELVRFTDDCKSTSSDVVIRASL